MVASAVEGLTPESVAIMDIHGALLSRPKKAQDADELSDEAIEYRHRVERDLLTKINSTLEPLLGAEKFRAGVSVECDFTSGEQSEETYDPEKSVMTSSQKTEEITSSANSTGGVPGTASSLPRPTGRAPGGGPTVRGEAKPSRSRPARPFDVSGCHRARSGEYPPPFWLIMGSVGKGQALSKSAS